jgi:hypothetical protein
MMDFKDRGVITHQPLPIKLLLMSINKGRFLARLFSIILKNNKPIYKVR